MSHRTLQSLLNERFAEHRQSRALEVDGTAFTYEELGLVATAGAEAIACDDATRPFVVVFAYRSQAAYIGVLSALRAGRAYLPVSHKFPTKRIAQIFQLSRSDVVFLGKELAGEFRDLLANSDDALPSLRVLYLEGEEESIGTLADEFPRHRFVPIARAAADSHPSLPQSSPGDYAYMLFTSGSTGTPKGIAITNENAVAYLDYVRDYFDFSPTDRFSQTFDLTFDYSVHDMFCCWLSGGCLCVIPASSLIAPGKFLETSEITVWFSVPSLAMTMDKLRMLRPDRFPGIRLSLFGGEAVSQSIVESWQAAAPHSEIYNVYGPTEATVNITHYRWDPAKSPAACVNGGVPLGQCFGNLEIRIVDDQGREAPPGQKGQLVVAGPQIANGYYEDRQRTQDSFRTLPDDGQRTWYFTGDLASRDDEGVIRYFGRIDFQVQICGHRVELPEIEGLLRKAAGTEYAVAIPWPFAPETGRADYLVAVVGTNSGADTDLEGLKRLCLASLPDYAVPSRFVCLDDFPLNINGKIDRVSIARLLRNDLP